MSEFEIQTEFVKFDDALGLAMGYAIICNKAGEKYFDRQGDHITEAAMLDAATDFMMKSRVSGDMHDRDKDGGVVPDGNVVFAWPLTKEIAKAFKIETDTTGLLIAMKPSAAVLQKFKDGDYTGFSIGGKRVEEEEVD